MGFGDFFWVFLKKNIIFGLKIHSRYCGTVEKRQKMNEKAREMTRNALEMIGFCHFLTVFFTFLALLFKTKQFHFCRKAEVEFRIWKPE